MQNQTLAADGGFFRLVAGRRVWTANPPQDFLKDTLTGQNYLTPEEAGPANLPDVIRLLNERSDAVPTEHAHE